MGEFLNRLLRRDGKQPRDTGASNADIALAQVLGGYSSDAPATTSDRGADASRYARLPRANAPATSNPGYVRRVHEDVGMATRVRAEGNGGEYAQLSQTNQTFVDVVIASDAKKNLLPSEASLDDLRNSHAANISALLREKDAIVAEATKLGVNPLKPTRSFPRALQAQLGGPSR